MNLLELMKNHNRVKKTRRNFHFLQQGSKPIIGDLIVEKIDSVYNESDRNNSEIVVINKIAITTNVAYCLLLYILLKR